MGTNWFIPLNIIIFLRTWSFQILVPFISYMVGFRQLDFTGECTACVCLVRNVNHLDQRTRCLLTDAVMQLSENPSVVAREVSGGLYNNLVRCKMRMRFFFYLTSQTRKAALESQLYVP